MKSLRGGTPRQAMLNYLPEDLVGDAVDKILEVVGLEAAGIGCDSGRTE